MNDLLPHNLRNSDFTKVRVAAFNIFGIGKKSHIHNSIRMKVLPLKMEPLIARRKNNHEYDFEWK